MAFAAAASAFLAFHAFVEIAARLRPEVSLARATDLSQMVLDHRGEALHLTLSRDSKFRLRGDHAAAPPLYLALLRAYEDKRFFEHAGVDYRALARAAYEAIAHQRIVSGGSTLTMQTARLLEGRQPGFLGKVRQIIAARRLEIDYGKSEILDLYLTTAPFGGNIEGLEAAARLYFGRTAAELSPAQTALLVAAPQSPSARELSGGQAYEPVPRLMRRAVARGVLDAGEATQISAAAARLATTTRRVTPADARAAARRLRSADPKARVQRTTLEARLQRRVRAHLRQALGALGPSANAAAIVARRRDGAVLAYIGSAREGAAGGFLDLARAPRSPGSALKPFVYGLAFEAGLAHPNTLFIDRPVRYGAYAPTNFDRERVGEITLRAALARSLNTAAIAVLARVGPDVFVRRLEEAGARITRMGGETRPGLAVALGGLGVSLEDMVSLYLSVAEPEAPPALRLDNGARPRPPQTPALSAPAAWAVTEALSWAAQPAGRLRPLAQDGAARIAFKTGTSHGRRDTWAIGFDRAHVVGVWIGRPDGGGMPGASGAKTAAPALFAIFADLARPALGVVADPPEGAAWLAASAPPQRLLRLAGSRAGRAPLRLHYPADGDEFAAAQGQPLVVTATASGGAAPFTWILNGDLVTAASPGTSDTLGRMDVALPCGPSTLQLIDASGAFERADVSRICE